MQDLPHSPAADRNKAPILAQLQAIVGGERGTALEIASGTGQHVTWFATHLPGWSWQPTDFDAQALPAIAERVAHAGLGNVLPPVRLDVTQPQWPVVGKFDLIYCANMLHIAPWEACLGLMAGAARHLAPGGVLVTYGPYFEDGVPAAAGNVEFDKSLRGRDAAWGIRRMEDVVKVAGEQGLVLSQRQAMPANNWALVFKLG